jgi:hypothetical protein
MPLSLPEVVRILQLTTDQQKQIRNLTEQAATAIHDLDKELPGQQRQDITKLREHLLDEARREALELLTKQQREKWDKLVGKP